MGKFLGSLSSVDSTFPVEELRLASVNLSAAQAVAPDADGILDGQATAADAVTVVTTFLKQPPFPRNLTILPGGTTASVPAGDVVVTGLDFAGAVISEDFAFLANATDATEGACAFKEITSITFPIQDGAGATYDVGWSDKIGLPYAFAHNAVLGATRDGVRETTFPTVTYDASDVSKNTVKLNGALNGKVLKIYLAV